MIMGDGVGDAHSMVGSLEIFEKTAPSEPTDATTVKLFLDSGTGELSVFKFDGVSGETVSLEDAASGGLPHDDDVVHFQGVLDNTKTLRIDVSSSTTSTASVLATKFTTAKTVTFPDLTGELMSLAGTQTVAGSKTFSATITAGNSGNAISLLGDIEGNNNDFNEIQALNFNDGGNITGTSGLIEIDAGGTSNDVNINLGNRTEFLVSADSVGGFLHVKHDFASEWPEVRLLNEYTNIQDDDTVGNFIVAGWNSADTATNWFALTVQAADITASSQDSLITFWIHSDESSLTADAPFLKAEGGLTTGAVKLGFFGASPQFVGTVSGDRSTYDETIITELLDALADIGLIIDNTTT